MRRLKTPNPYCGFKDDSERRRALNAKALWHSLVGIAFALFGGSQLTEVFPWLIRHMHWFQ